MASTYSDLKFELIGTGDQSGTWGTTTNTNLGTAIEQAIVGMATISSGFVTNSLTLTLTDTNAAQNARALVLNLTQALSGAGTLNVPAIQKPYMIINATGQTVTVKVTGQTGVAVPTGTRTFLYNNGTDVGVFQNYFSSLTLGAALPIASGGTGTTSTTFVNLTTNVTGALPVANGGTGITTGTSGGVPYFSASNTIASSAALAANALVIGGGAGVAPATTTTGTGILTFLGTPSSANLAAAVTDETGSGSLVFATSPSLTTPVLGTPTSGNLNNCTADGTNKVGYRNIPSAGTAKTTAYTLAVGDVGEFIEVGSGGSIEIPDATFSAGDAILVFNNTSGSITITCTITTAYIAGTDADKATVSLATRGIASILFASGTACVITGNVS